MNEAFARGRALDVSELPTVVFGHRSLMWWGTLDLKRVQLWLVASVAFGVAFAVIRIFEFAALNVRWDSNAYGSVVWMLLVLHTTHILTDLVDTVVLAVLFFTGPLDGKRYVDVSENSFYWYFVVATWIPIYLVIHWGARTP